MKKLYNKFFYIPKHGKIPEKVMIVRVATMAIIVIACLAAMSFTAYAYFSYNVAFDSKIIQAARFEANVSITTTDLNAEQPVVNKEDDFTHSALLKAGVTYNVVLTPGESTASTGFCVITADGCTETYHTQQLGVDKSVVEKTTSSVTFTLTVSNDTTLEISSRWGTSSHYEEYWEKGEACELYITNDNGSNAIEMKINRMDNAGDESNSKEETSSTESTESSAETQSEQETNNTQQSESETTTSEENTSTESTESTTASESVTSEPEEITEQSQAEAADTDNQGA